MSTEKNVQLIQRLGAEVRKFLAAAILFNETVADQVGLNARDLQFLNVLELYGSATPGEFAAWSRLTTGGVTVVLDRLEKAGYVKREPNPRDRRSCIVVPILARARRLQAIYRSKGEALVQVLSCYNERQLRLLLDFFDKTNRSGEERPKRVRRSRPVETAAASSNRIPSPRS